MWQCECPSHPASGPTPCLECVHASVHVFMSTCLPMSTPHPMNSLMETWVTLCDIVYLSQSLCFWSHTLDRMCTCNSNQFMSTWLSLSAPPPMHTLMETWVPLYGSVFVSQSPHFCSHTLFRMCTCISTCIYVHMSPHDCSTPYG